MTLLLSILMSWALSQNNVEAGISEATLTITNQSEQVLTADNWKIGYCQMSVSPVSADPAQVRVRQICASYHLLEPTPSFEPLKQGESRTFRLRQKGSITLVTGAPQGAFLIRQDGSTEPIAIAPVTYSDPRIYVGGWQPLPQADGEWLYEHYHEMIPDMDTAVGKAAAKDGFGLLPRPKMVRLNSQKRSRPIAKMQAFCRIEKGLPAEGYRLEIQSERIIISSSTKAGRFYAEQTLGQLIRNEQSTLPIGTIIDYPDYPYRGFMLDIARNYTTPDHIADLLRTLASYKVNRLHFHLVDDEAWRIEIPGLPELTEVSSRRGYSPLHLADNAAQFALNQHILPPAYSSKAADGYLTRQEFIRLLRIADSLHIQVIPEFDLPGHSRAAIKAMEARYYRYMNTDPALAREYLLTDFDAAPRTYVSAQYYTDNVMAVNLPSAERFVLKVMTEIQHMYEEAGVALTHFNIGGDEVADGALTKEEHRAFIQRLNKAFREAGLHAAGWEELAQWLPADEHPLCYCWRPGQKNAARLAAEQYPIVLSCADYLYVDMSYVNHPEENGLHWAAYTDEWKTIRFRPEVEHAIGIQAQLFAETIRDYDQVQRYLFPKLFGIIEHEWNKHTSPDVMANWQHILNTQLRLREASSQPYHLAMPSIHVADGEVSMFCPVDFAEIRYTTDGTEPTTTSALYTTPFALKKATTIRARAFTKQEQSACSWWQK